VVAGIAFLVYRRRNGRGRTDHAAATTPPEDQSPQPSSSHGGALNSKSPIIQTSAEDISTKSETEPPQRQLVQDLDDQTEQPLGQTKEACLPILGEPAESDETRCDESQVSAPQESMGAFLGEKYEHFDIGEVALEPEDGVGTAHTAGSFGEEPEIHSSPKAEEEPRAVESHDTKAERSQQIEDHDHERGNASPTPTPNVPASIFPFPEDSSAKIETKGKVTGEPTEPTVVDQAGLGTKVLDAGVTTSIEETPTKDDKTAKERKPRKYQGLVRSAPQPQDNTGQTGHCLVGDRGDSEVRRVIFDSKAILWSWRAG
jgi:hypothetical protein